MTTRIDGPRSVRIRFSTGRAAEIRVPNFTAMRRSGVIDDHDLADLQDVLAGGISAALLPARLLDSILAHVFLDPDLALVGFDALDEIEEREAISWCFRAYLESQVPAEAVPDDDELEELDEEEADPLEAAADRLPPAEALPGSKAPEA